MTKNYPLHPGEIMIHEKSGTMGKVKSTLYPKDNRLDNITLTLVLKDSSELEFRYLELRLATEKERIEFDAK